MALKDFHNGLRGISMSKIELLISFILVHSSQYIQVNQCSLRTKFNALFALLVVK